MSVCEITVLYFEIAAFLKFWEKSNMYEDLTRFLPFLNLDSFGQIIEDNVNDGSPEHPKHWPIIDYDDTVRAFIEAVYDFM